MLNLDENIKDGNEAFLLLNSLLDMYEHLTATLLHGKDKVDFDVVHSALLSFEYRKKD